MKKIIVAIIALATMSMAACSLQPVKPIAQNPGGIYSHH